MKTETDYLVLQEIKDIDLRILNLSNKIKSYFNNFIPYISIADKISKYEFFWLEDVSYIEEAIDYIVSFLYKQNGYIDKKIWISNNEIIDRTFDYTDYNRWLNNLNLLESIDITKEKWLWNLKQYEAEWGETTSLKWRENNG